MKIYRRKIYIVIYNIENNNNNNNNNKKINYLFCNYVYLLK